MGTGFRPFKFSRADIATYTAGSTVNDQATTAPFSRIGSTGAAATLTSLASPVAGQLRILGWNRSGTVTLKHDTGPTTANRFLFANNADDSIFSSSRPARLVIYDPTSARWRGCI